MIRVYNTLTNKKEDFVTLEPNKVKMYICGPTVYNYIHIGNARPYVIFDAVRRYLTFKGYDVEYVQNFTDIDDKIIKRSIEEKSSMKEVSNKYIDEFFKDIDGLNIQRATVYPRVTENMPEIIEMIETLIKKEYAYEIKGSVYFSTKSFENYGKLSNRKLDDMEAGARIAINDEKQDPMDFVLWKPAKPQEPFWESPWGNGRPGWHIECSVMSKKFLGEEIDIHAGGEDLIFPHHENEIAQSECANEKPLARFWLHNSMLNIDNKKMSKSTGNFFTVRDIVEKYDYDIIRFFILNGHYRSPLNFSDELLLASKNALGRIRNCCADLEYIIENNNELNMTENEKELIQEAKKFKTNFIANMNDDFNTPNAISDIFDFVKFSNSNTNNNTTKAFATVLLKGIKELCDILGIRTKVNIKSDKVHQIEELIQQRQKAREEKDWKLSDEIRDGLLEIGVIIKDTPEGTSWSYKG